MPELLDAFTRYDVLLLILAFGMVVLGFAVADLSGKVKQLRRELEDREVL